MIKALGLARRVQRKAWKECCLLKTIRRKSVVSVQTTARPFGARPCSSTSGVPAVAAEINPGYRSRGPLPKVATLLEEAEEDLLAFYAFPIDHWRKLRSTNPLERVNREIGRRTEVVGIFPNDRALLRLAASVVIEQNDEWLVGHRYLSAHSLNAVLDQEKESKDRKETRELTRA